MSVVNIIMEAKLSTVVASARGTSSALPVPRSLWILLGDLTPDTDDEDEGFDPRPLWEDDANTGAVKLNDAYMIGSISYDHFQKLASDHACFNIDDYGDGPSCCEVAKKLHDIFCELGHDVFLFDMCDY